MFERRSLRWPIMLGVTMIVLLVALTVGWVLLSVIGALSDREFALVYWILLSVGATFLVLVLVGVVLYLMLSVKAINLSRRQSNFIDSVTHELKSPIASLKLYLQTLNRRHVPPEEQADFFRFMLEDVERLDGLINHLLEAARLEKKTEPQEIEDVEVAALLAECAAAVALRYHLPAEAVTMEMEPCIVPARREDLEIIFRNLLDNAVKYGGTEPQVRVALHPVTRELVEVLIADNGRGISPSERRRIFGRFVRLGSELEREKPGTGLGLYIVRTLVHRWKGSIKVRGREPSPGTVFELRLPGYRVITEPAATIPAQPSADAEVA